MKLLVIALAASSVMAPNQAPAEETNKPLQLKPKVITTNSIPHNYAPFITPSGEPQLSLALPRSDGRDAGRSSCREDQALCYDSSSGHIVYRPARQLMPDIPGLRPENISVKRNRIVFRYSF